MKVVLLAGGKGTRIGEETKYKPKPMIEIGGKPILWHIMKGYSSYGYNDFIICCGYKGNMIKEYFLNYHMKYSDVKFDMSSGNVTVLDNKIEPWNVTMVNTGLHTLTAKRIKKIKKYIGEDDEFMLTYGDGVSDINIEKLVEFHRKTGKYITISITKPEGRFGAVSLHENSHCVKGFEEKARDDQSYVNMGFMVCNKKVFDYLGFEDVMLEKEPFNKLVAEHQMAAYEHHGFWSPMDNIKDRDYLEGLWIHGFAPWL